MHAIVMVHKMQRMALSSHQLLPAAAGGGAEKADSENTRNSENNDDDPHSAKGEEDQQGDQGFETNSITHKHWTEQKTEQDWEIHTTQHTQTQKTRMGRQTHEEGKRHILHAFM